MDLNRWFRVEQAQQRHLGGFSSLKSAVVERLCVCVPLVSPIPYYNDRSSIVVSFWVLSPQGPHVGKEQGEGH